MAIAPLPNHTLIQQRPLQLAISLATPVIIPPIGVAAILIFMMIALEYPGMTIAIAKNLLIIMVLDFLVMSFIDKILKIPGLMQVLQIVGAVIVFMQVALAVDTILTGFTDLGLFKEHLP